MKTETLYIDMDNVLVDFSSAFERLDEETLQKYEGRLDEVNNKSQKVVKVLDDPRSRARRVYSMTVEQASAQIEKEDTEKIVQLEQRETHKLDELMKSD